MRGCWRPRGRSRPGRRPPRRLTPMASDPAVETRADATRGGAAERRARSLLTYGSSRMNQVAMKLSAALKGYIAGNYQETGDPLEGVEISLGRSPEVKVDQSRLEIIEGDAGGELAEVGNYEMTMTLKLITDFEKQEAAETEAVLRERHGLRVSALLGIFGIDMTRTLPTGLMALDAELGCSWFALQGVTETGDETRVETDVTVLFDGYLV